MFYYFVLFFKEREREREKVDSKLTKPETIKLVEGEAAEKRQTLTLTVHRVTLK